MAKKTPSKSTAKKKAATKKKSAAQKKAAAKKNSVAPKKAASKKSDAVKTTPKKTAAKKENAKTTKKKIPNEKPVKKKETAKTSAKKRPAKKPAAPSKKKAVSIPELLKLKFESWQPEKLIKIAPDKTFQQGFTAPPAVDTDDKKEADRIKALLAKTFDLTVSDAKEEPVIKETKTPDLQEKLIDKPKAEKAVTEPEPPNAVPVKEEVAAEPEAEKPEAETVETVKVAEKPAKKPEKPVVELEKKAEEPAPEKPAPPQPIKKETPPPMPPAPAITMEKPEPENQALKMLIGCIAGVFALLIIASTMNTDNYYLKPAKNALEIWQGDFSPNGKKLIMSIPGATIPEPVKSKYTRAEALLFAFNYYISEADAAAGKKTIKGYDAALKHLKQAAALHNIDKSRKELLAKKISAIKGAKNNLIKKSSKKKQPKKSSKKKIIKGARHTSQKTATKI